MLLKCHNSWVQKRGSSAAVVASPMPAATIALIGEFDPAFPPHPATEAAVTHAVGALGVNVRTEWLPTDEIEVPALSRYEGLWIAPGSPYKNFENTLEAIRAAREQAIPCLGTCGGFQHMILEYARHVLGCDGAHAEYDPDVSNLFITRLDCSLAGRELPLQFEAGSQTARIYGATSAVERYYCGFGVNPERVALLKSGPLRVVGADAEGEVRVIELPGHPYFIGTLFVPQMRSRPEGPHPLITAFVRAVSERAAATPAPTGANSHEWSLRRCSRPPTPGTCRSLHCRLPR
jgi:CTP synthase (UTP-ammonia lyase)